MTTQVQPIPEGYHSVTPHLIVKSAAKAIEFYKKAFDATEVMRSEMPSGNISHAEIQMGDSKIMLADESPQTGALAPETIGGSPITICLYVKDVDVTTSQAVAAGAHMVMPVQDMFYGDRVGVLVDPFGHRWYVCTHIEDVSPEEIQRRAKQAYGKQD